MDHLGRIGELKANLDVVMTPLQIIEHMRVPNTRSVFFLGCFEKRVTVFSQQIRALNLVAAILDQNLVRANGRVAIIGAGAAGLTAAIALAKAASGLRAIHVYEMRSEVLELQEASNRYLHPHNYDWPAGPATEVSAGLPILNWSAGPARDVQKHLRKQFDDESRGTQIQLRTDTTVTGVRPFNMEGVRVVLRDSAYRSDVYDAVILSVGFGTERFIDGDTPSYWTLSQLEGPVLPAGTMDIFVSGNGDGGLVDFMGAAFRPMPHQEICNLITGLNLGPARDELNLIEEEAWLPGAAVDIYEAYRTRVIPLLPNGVLTEIGDHLRANVRVRLHTRDPQLFKRNTAILNRLGCTLALVADENRGNNALSTTVGLEFDGPVPAIGDIKLMGEDAFHPWRRFLRLGPDGHANLGHFQECVDAMPAAATNPLEGFRPQTPALTPEAAARFAAFHSPDMQPLGPPEPAPAADTSVRLRIDRAADGDLVVTGNLEPAALAEAWRDERAVVVDCSLAARDAPTLVGLLARLCGHALSSAFFVHDRRRWAEALGYAVRGRALPGNLEIRFQVEGPREQAAAANPQLIPLPDFVATVHRALDVEVLRTLHEQIYDVVGRPDPIECGWAIEAGLRTALWALWEDWRPALQGDANALRRFLVLLADDRDYEDGGETTLVRVGTKTIRSHLLKAALFALAFVVGSERPMSPATAHPGNLRGAAGAGHACGVTWIEGRDIGARVAERPWSTQIVLLAELKAAFEFLRGEPRMDELIDDRPRVGEIAATERPLVLGADDQFLDALEQGLPALNIFLTGVLAWRADSARDLIEGEA
ncbi:ABC-three component system protein [Phenylobacterium immobile]|uniref:ABC-three component system protein n=1 Tax=Phenylobacterium immobile TaxID=21 RepID=UPI000B81F179|nr:ABC-three component system protein [Phenylobacterium immobile]